MDLQFLRNSIQSVTTINATFSWFLADSWNQYQDDGKSAGDENVIELDEPEDDEDEDV